MPRFKIARRWVGDGQPTYFIADISANHDGDLERAKALIHLAAQSGANAAKFQNFRASRIVSERGFNALGKFSHQSRWKKSVYEVYQAATVPWEWTPLLKAECDAAGIHYFSTPYDLEAVDMLAPFVPVFKIGSGDITWPEMLAKIAQAGKPVLLATGAATIGDVQRAVGLIQTLNPSLALLQCNTNYTGSLENFKHIHLNVLAAYRTLFPSVSLGLSDHTPGHATVLGAVALGARFVEKHFTDDCHREGPDHPFSMTPRSWREMVDRTRELEYALGDSDKRIAGNERETVVVQRRCLRAARDLKPGLSLKRKHIAVLRPAPPDAIFPYDLDRILKLRLRVAVRAGDFFRWNMFE
jgi:N-acetylneuraminate synthase